MDVNNAIRLAGTTRHPVTRVAALLIVAALLGACGGDHRSSSASGGSGSAQAPVPLDEDQWRTVADGPGPAPGLMTGSEQLTAAADPPDLARQWEAYAAEGTPDVVEDHEIAILLAFGESGTCPQHISEITVAEEDDEVRVRRELEGGPDQACTDDFNPRTVVLAVVAAALPSGSFRLATLDGQRPRWEGVAPRGAPGPPSDHRDRGLGYGQSEPVARLEASTPRVTRGEVAEVVVTPTPTDVEPAVGDGTTTDPHAEPAPEDVGPEGEGDEPRPMTPATLERWDTHRWVLLSDDGTATEDEAELEPSSAGHPAVERIVFGELAVGESAPAARVATAELEPGWYRVELGVVGFGQRGPGQVSAHIEVVAEDPDADPDQEPDS